MKRLALIAAIAAVSAFPAHAESLHCNFESDYAFSQQGRTLVFTRDAAPGKRIMIQDSRLIVDGKDLSLSVQDKQHVAQFENEMRLLIPQVKHVTTEAIDIAFAALIEVSRALNGEQGNPTVTKLQNSRIALHNSINNDPSIIINDDIDTKIIEPIITDFIPDVVGAAVKQALSLAFSGDEKKTRAFEARMSKMEKEIEAKVETRAEKLEPLAKAMCNRVRNMDRIENSISVRLNNQQRINLLDTKAP